MPATTKALQAGSTGMRHNSLGGNKVFAQSGLGVVEERLQAAYKKVAPAIVKFSYGNTWLGSGVIVTPEVHIIVGGSVRSVLRDELLDLRLVDGRKVQATALGWTSEDGLGMLKITEPGPWPHVEISPATRAEPGQYCFMLSYGFNAEKSNASGGLERVSP